MSIAWTEQVLPVNGIDLHVTQAGTGEPLLMIHGVTVDATFEHHEIEQLADTYVRASNTVKAGQPDRHVSDRDSARHLFLPG